MPRTRKPRAGSLQYWPRVRAKRPTARVRSWVTKPKMLAGFPAYKAGMTHVHILETKSTARGKGMQVQNAVTILECPPVQVIGIRAYERKYLSERVAGDVLAEKMDKELARTLSLPKKTHTIGDLNIDKATRISVLVATQPKKIGFKKKPDVLEIAVGGKDAKEQFEAAKEMLGKELDITSVFKAGEQVDAHGVTTGRGFMGPVKRFGIHLKRHKSEKGRRQPGSVGAWHGPKNWTVPHAGQTGYHQRTELNKWIVKIGDKPEEVNQKGGITRYGEVKNQYVLLKGSIMGPKKRLITLTPARRPNKQFGNQAPQVSSISVASKQ